MAGIKATPPFGALTLVGTGGTLIELLQDRALSLSPVTSAEAEAMIRQQGSAPCWTAIETCCPAT